MQLNIYLIPHEVKLIKSRGFFLRLVDLKLEKNINQCKHSIYSNLEIDITIYKFKLTELHPPFKNVYSTF